MIEFKKLLGQKVEKLYLILWSPFGEQKISDISFGFIFQNKNNKLYVIGVAKDELWFLHILYQY